MFYREVRLEKVRADNYYDDNKNVNEAYCRLISRKKLSKSDRRRLESIISVSAYCSCLYACLHIGGRFKKGEKAISKSAKQSIAYAICILKGRFIKGEPAIKKDIDIKRQYEERFNIIL